MQLPFTYFSQVSAFRHEQLIIFALFIVTAFTACPFSIKKCAKMGVFFM